MTLPSQSSLDLDTAARVDPTEFLSFFISPYMRRAILYTLLATELPSSTESRNVFAVKFSPAILTVHCAYIICFLIQDLVHWNPYSETHPRPSTCTKQLSCSFIKYALSHYQTRSNQMTWFCNVVMLWLLYFELLIIVLYCGYVFSVLNYIDVTFTIVNVDCVFQLYTAISDVVCLNNLLTYLNVPLAAVTESTTSWLWRLTRSTAPVYLHTWAITSTLAKQHEHYVHLTLYSSPCHSPGLSSRSVPSDAQLHLSGTHYLHSSPTAALWRPLNFGGWKRTVAVYLSTVEYTADLSTFPPAPLKY